MADEPTIQIDPADIVEPADVSTEVEQQDTTPADSSTEETKSPEVAEETPEETETEATEDSDEPTESEETDTEEKPRAKNNAQDRIRNLANENRQLRQQMEQLNAQVYQPQTADDLVNEGLSETDAKVESLRQEVEIERFNRQVTELNYGLEAEAKEVLRDFPVFNPDSDQYNGQLASQVQQLYQQTAGLQTDPNTGLVISANVLPYNFYKTFADAINVTAQENQIKGQKATEKMLASVDTPSSAAPKTEKEDPFLKGFTKGLSLDSI